MRLSRHDLVSQWGGGCKTMFEKSYEAQNVRDLVKLIPHARGELDKGRDTRVAAVIGCSYPTLCAWRAPDNDRRIHYDCLCHLVEMAAEYAPAQVAVIRKRLIRGLGGLQDQQDDAVRRTGA